MIARAGKSIEIKIPSKFGYEKVVMASVAALAEKMGFDQSKVEDVKTAVGEAITNSIEHGNNMNSRANVVVTMTMKDNRLEISIRDKGNKKLPATRDIPNIDEKISGQSDARGWGLYLIESLMNEVRFKETPKGRELKMVLNL